MSHMMFVNVLVCIFISFFKMMVWKKKKKQIENKIDVYLCFEGTISLLFLVKTYVYLVMKELKNKKIV